MIIIANTLHFSRTKTFSRTMGIWIKRSKCLSHLNSVNALHDPIQLLQDSAASARDIGDTGSISGLGGSPGGG